MAQALTIFHAFILILVITGFTLELLPMIWDLSKESGFFRLFCLVNYSPMLILWDKNILKRESRVTALARCMDLLYYF